MGGRTSFANLWLAIVPSFVVVPLFATRYSPFATRYRSAIRCLFGSARGSPSQILAD